MFQMHVDFTPKDWTLNAAAPADFGPLLISSPVEFALTVTHQLYAAVYSIPGFSQYHVGAETRPFNDRGNTSERI